MARLAAKQKPSSRAPVLGFYSVPGGTDSEAIAAFLGDHLKVRVRAHGGGKLAVRDSLATHAVVRTFVSLLWSATKPGPREADEADR